jgi:hypothetical protein
MDIGQYQKKPYYAMDANRSWRGIDNEALPFGYLKNIHFDGDDLKGDFV